MPPLPQLPVSEALPRLAAALRAGSNAVLVAPPGAGKTTLAPLALMAEPWAEGGRILVLEPRRVAARAAARRMAELLGEDGPGGTVGLATRLDRAFSDRTRVEVVTEGLLVRRLQSDPGLEGVAAVLFDEAHERNLDTDLALALCLDLQRALRPELRLVAMSATLDVAAFRAVLGTGARAPDGRAPPPEAPDGRAPPPRAPDGRDPPARAPDGRDPPARAPDGRDPPAPAPDWRDPPVIESMGRAFPVAVEHRPRDLAELRELPDAMAAAIRAALRDHPGDLLAFLPGWGEIRRTAERLGGIPAEVVPLHGELPPAEQDRALAPLPGGVRKVVLATSIAETSLTVPGVRIVVDGGWRRTPRLDPASGLARLVTVRISRAAAEQRAGRAGRTAPGVAIRLWTEATHRGLAPQDRPEILEAELSGLALDCAAWGAAPAALPFLDPPPAGALAAGRALLAGLDALDAQGRITPTGRAMARLGTHPRLARMLLEAATEGEKALAADLAALLEERDPIRGRDAPADINARLELLHGGDHPAADRATVGRIRRAAALHRRRLRLHGNALPGGEAGPLLAAGFPDRIAVRRGGMDGAFRLAGLGGAGGQGARLAAGDPLGKAPLLAVAELELQGTEARIRMAAPLDLATLERRFPDRLRWEEGAAFDARAGAVLARRRRLFGPLVLEDHALPSPDPATLAAALARAVAERGLRDLDWSEAARSFRARVARMARLEPEGGWPDLSDEALAATAEAWLAPHLHGATKLAAAKALDLHAVLRGLLPRDRAARLDRELPARLPLPAGRSAAVDYAAEVPTLEARAQHLFGLDGLPPLAGGRVRLQVALLSPAGRPIAVTGDLAGFWRGGWAEARKDMRGRYPRHDWPERPWEATAPPPRG